MSLIIQVKNVSELCEKLKEQLQEWPYMADEEVTIERAEPVNKSSDRCPWIGIYRQQQTLETRTLGLGTGYRRHNITLALVMQEASNRSGQACEEKLERLVSEAISAICSDESIRGSVIALDPSPFVLTYSSYQVEENSFFQETVFTFTVQTNVNAQEA